MGIERLNPISLHASNWRSEAVRAGDMVLISGQGPFAGDARVVGAGDIDAQAAQIFKNLELAVEAAGGTMYDLTKITAYLTRPEYTAAIARARESYLPVRNGARPAASTTVVVPTHTRPDVLMEVEAVAVVGATAQQHVSIDPPKLPKGPGHPHAARAGAETQVTGIMARRWGQILGKGDAEIQARFVFDQLDYVLESAGATRADVTRHMTYYTHPSHREAIRKVEEEYYSGLAPAVTAVYVYGLGAGPDPLVEIEATATVAGPKRAINPIGLSKPRSGASIVCVDREACIAGQVPVDAHGANVGEGDIQVQLAQVYLNLGQALDAAGAKRSSVLKTTTYLTRAAYFDPFVEAQKQFFGEDLPASTVVVVQGLDDPQWLVEIEGIAALD